MKKVHMLLIIFITITAITLLDTRFSTTVFADSTTDEVSVNNVAPTIEYLNITGDADSGGAGITLVENDSQTIYCEAIVIDENGAADINTVLGNPTGYFWDLNAIAMLGADGVDDHYTIDTLNDCAWSGPWTPPGYLVDVADTITCSVDVGFPANPDSGGADWRCYLEVEDDSAVAVNEVNTTGVNDLTGIILGNSSISFGTLNIGATSGEKEVIIHNMGNVVFDVRLNGTSLDDVGTNTIEPANVVWENDTGAGSAWHAMRETTPLAGVLYDLTHVKPTTMAGVQNSTMWKITIPIGTTPLSHTGVIEIIAA